MREVDPRAEFGPQVGMLATFRIGSDAYGMTITEIVNFKSGAKAGTPKFVFAKSNLRPDREPQCFRKTVSGFQKTDGDGYFYGHLALGYAEEYWDPHF